MKFQLITTGEGAYIKEKLLRWEVLNKPLGLPPGSEVFPEEEESLHFVALEKRQIVGCVLFHQESDRRGRLYQLAISQEYQGQGFRRKMVVALEKELVKRGVREVHLQASDETVDFYRSLGFRPTEISEEEALPFQTLTKRLIHENA